MGHTYAKNQSLLTCSSDLSRKSVFSFAVLGNPTPGAPEGFLWQLRTLSPGEGCRSKHHPMRQRPPFPALDGRDDAGMGATQALCTGNPEKQDPLLCSFCPLTSARAPEGGPQRNSCLSSALKEPRRRRG